MYPRKKSKRTTIKGIKSRSKTNQHKQRNLHISTFSERTYF